MTATSIPAQLSDACANVRLATDDDAVAGVRPNLVASPASTAEASSVMRAAAALGLAVIPRGTGTKLHWGNPPERADLVIDTTRLDQVTEHAAGDLVAAVQAGVTLEQLAGVLAGAGQRLALDRPASGTIGGVISTGVAGPLRLRYGTPRDLLIGITIVRADGTVAKSGGKVVKNVAGYDLGKLFAGARGTLGLITQATFRLHPLPAATAYVTVTCDSAAASARLLADAQQPSVAPVAAELHRAALATPYMLAVAIEGDTDGVAKRSDMLAEKMAVKETGSVVAVASQPPAWWGRGAAAQADGTVLQVAFLAGRLGSVLARLEAAAARTGLDPVLGGSAASGVLHVALPAGAEPGQAAGFLADLRAGDTISSVVVQHAPPAVRSLIDLFGPVPSLSLMRAVKQQFDPGRLLSPGRFAGGI